MPHQCVRCRKLFVDGAAEILTGCACGSKLFFYIKQEKYDMITQEKVVSEVEKLSTKDRQQIELDIYDLLGKEIDTNLPVVLDIESINIIKPGKFELDLAQLFNKQQPLVYRVEEGKYIIDLANSFRESRRL